MCSQAIVTVGRRAVTMSGMRRMTWAPMCQVVLLAPTAPDKEKDLAARLRPQIVPGPHRVPGASAHRAGPCRALHDGPLYGYGEGHTGREGIGPAACKYVTAEPTPLFGHAC